MQAPSLLAEEFWREKDGAKRSAEIAGINPKHF